MALIPRHFVPVQLPMPVQSIVNDQAGEALSPGVGLKLNPKKAKLLVLLAMTWCNLGLCGDG